MTARAIAVVVAVALLLGGPAQPLLAQPATPAPAGQPAPATPPSPPASQPPAAPPDLFKAAAAASESSPERRTDVYDVAGGVVTVLKAPFNAALCALGGAFGLLVFAGTLGSGYKAAARTVEEGCGGPWVVTGDDLRPDPAPAPNYRMSEFHPAELQTDR